MRAHFTLYALLQYSLKRPTNIHCVLFHVDGEHVYAVRCVCLPVCVRLFSLFCCIVHVIWLVRMNSEYTLRWWPSHSSHNKRIHVLLWTVSIIRCANRINNRNRKKSLKRNWEKGRWKEEETKTKKSTVKSTAIRADEKNEKPPNTE